MKSASLFLGAVILAAVAVAQVPPEIPIPGAPANPTPAPAPKAVKPAAPAKVEKAAPAKTVPAKAEKAAPAKPGQKADAKKPAKPEDEMGTIEGQTIARANGKFLGLTLRDGKFVLSFYDEKKKPEKADVTRATARWNDPQSPGYKRAVMNIEPSGLKLAATTFVRPPYAFKLWLTLLKGEGEGAQAAESYTIDFSG
jgi:hypothetical protein